MNKLLVFGETGQVAQQINRLGKNVTCLGRRILDIRSFKSVSQAIRNFGPDVVINAAAFTGVDKAETYENDAFNVNAVGAKNIARACGAIPLIHLSTDYVFDGKSQEPYAEDAEVSPINAYGRSKLAGEIAVRNYAKRYIILRTAWVYSFSGNNFLRTMVGLMEKQNQLRVVNDQLGSPTSAQSIAEAVLFLATPLSGSETNQFSFNEVFHYVDDGITTWHEFAETIYFSAQKIGIPSIKGKKIDIRAISSLDYLAPAKRPSYSVLSNKKFKGKFDFPIKSWKIRLNQCMQNFLKVEKNNC